MARAVMLPKPTIGPGTAAAWVTAVPVSRAIPSAETLGRKVAVAAFDPRTPPTPSSSPCGCEFNPTVVPRLVSAEKLIRVLRLSAETPRATHKTCVLYASSSVLPAIRRASVPANITTDERTQNTGGAEMYDVIVVGARVAGSPLAMLLARKGYKVLVVDARAFPAT